MGLKDLKRGGFERVEYPKLLMILTPAEEIVVLRLHWEDGAYVTCDGENCSLCLQGKRRVIKIGFFAYDILEEKVVLVIEGSRLGKTLLDYYEKDLEPEGEDLQGKVFEFRKIGTGTEVSWSLPRRENQEKEETLKNGLREIKKLGISLEEAVRSRLLRRKAEDEFEV